MPILQRLLLVLVLVLAIAEAKISNGEVDSGNHGLQTLSAIIWKWMKATRYWMAYSVFLLGIIIRMLFTWFKSMQIVPESLPWRILAQQQHMLPTVTTIWTICSVAVALIAGTLMETLVTYLVHHCVLQVWMNMIRTCTYNEGKRSAPYFQLAPLVVLSVSVVGLQDLYEPLVTLSCMHFVASIFTIHLVAMRLVNVAASALASGMQLAFCGFAFIVARMVEDVPNTVICAFILTTVLACVLDHVIKRFRT